MHSTTRFARLKSLRSTAAGLALAIALAGGASLGLTGLTATPAAAQEQQQPSAGFAAVYQELATMVQPETADFAGAQARIPQLLAAVENNRDRDLAGNLVLNIGTNVDDRQLQRQGLMLRLESGLVPAEQVGQFNWFVGSLSYDFDEWATARQYMMVAQERGFSPEGNDLVQLIAQTYMEEEQPQQALDYLTAQIAAADAAGTPVNERWLLAGLQTAYDYDLSEPALAMAERVVRDYPTETNWRNALQIVSQMYDLDNQARVDLYRLMFLKNTLDERQDTTRYIEDLDPRIMANEVQRVLARGVETGAFTSSDPYYTEVRGIVEARAGGERSGVRQTIADARSGDALDAVGAGDVLLSVEDYAQAEELFALALQRGADADMANTRIGIAQAQQGKYAEALATFGQVSGNRAPIARMWTVYVNERMGS